MPAITYKVFISSTYLDNLRRRKIVEDAVIAAGMQPVGMERFTAEKQTAVEACRRLLRECDIYVGIVGHRYGWIPDGYEISITEIEYEGAEGKPRLIFQIDDSIPIQPDRDLDSGSDRGLKLAKLDAFKAKYSKAQMPARFTDDNLGQKVLTALLKQREELERPEADARLPSASVQTVDFQALNGIKARKQFTERLSACQRDHLASWRLFDLPRDIRLEEVFVQEIIRETKAGGILFPFAGRSEPKRDEELLQEILAPVEHGSERKTLWIIESDAGAGKTTLLRNWAVNLFDRRASSGVPTPLFVSLRSLSQAIKRLSPPRLEAVTLGESIHIFSPEVDVATASQPFQLLEHARSQSRKIRTYLPGLKRVAPDWLLFFDGFDELDESLRPLFLDWLSVPPPNFRAIITTRRHVLKSLVGARHYEVCDFSKEQVNKFLVQWFKHDPDLGQQLIARSAEMMDLCKVPLLLTCLAIDVERSRQIPFGQELREIQVYRRVAEILLDEWDAHRRRSSPDRRSMEGAFNVLAAVARNTPFDENVSCSYLIEVCQSCARSDLRSQDLLHLITQSGRVLVGCAEFGFSFGHKALYDYFLSYSLSSIYGGQ